VNPSGFPTKILFSCLPYVIHLILILKLFDGEHKLSRSRTYLLFFLV
jgi:hypothetical protein